MEKPKKMNYIEKYGIACMLGSILGILLFYGQTVVLFSVYGAATFLFIVGMVFFLKPKSLNWKIIKYIKFSFTIIIIIILIEVVIRFVL